MEEGQGCGPSHATAGPAGAPQERHVKSSAQRPPLANTNLDGATPPRLLKSRPAHPPVHTLLLPLQMEDMKGKIRVYCRVRPILQMEKDRGQTGAKAGRGCGRAAVSHLLSPCLPSHPECLCFRHLRNRRQTLPSCPPPPHTPTHPPTRALAHPHTYTHTHPTPHPSLQRRSRFPTSSPSRCSGRARSGSGASTRCLAPTRRRRRCLRTRST